MDTHHHPRTAGSLRSLWTSISILSTNPEARRRAYAAFFLTLALAAGLGSARVLDSRAREQVRIEGPGYPLLRTLLLNLDLKLSETGPQAGPAPSGNLVAWIDPEGLELWATLPDSGQWTLLGRGWNGIEALALRLRAREKPPLHPRGAPVSPKVLANDPRHWRF